MWNELGTHTLFESWIKAHGLLLTLLRKYDGLEIYHFWFTYLKNDSSREGFVQHLNSILARSWFGGTDHLQPLRVLTPPKGSWEGFQDLGNILTWLAKSCSIMKTPMFLYGYCQSYHDFFMIMARLSRSESLSKPLKMSGVPCVCAFLLILCSYAADLTEVASSSENSENNQTLLWEEWKRANGKTYRGKSQNFRLWI